MKTDVKLTLMTFQKSISLSTRSAESVPADTTYIVPVFVWEFLTRVSSLDPGAVDQDIRLPTLFHHGRNDLFHRGPVRQFGHMDYGLAADAVHNLITGFGIRLIPLTGVVSCQLPSSRLLDALWLVSPEQE